MVFYSQLAHYTVAKNIFYSGQSLIPLGYCIGFLLKCSCPFQLDQFHSMDPVNPQPHNNIVHLKVFFFIFEKAHVIIKQKQYLVYLWDLQKIKFRLCYCFIYVFS